ncbi:substrate-binding domain-containing protein [Egbenema bharatensis]|uniref:substrate-binding domain-containing protein n=1 Tax=Egbenema bharatensis TaxID=3463334 RepID=UPI003A85B230
MTHDHPPESITLKDIAKATGVSRTTVSNAFNRPDQLSPELRHKILSIAQQMGYLAPNPMGRMLRTGRTGAIGLVFHDSLSYAFADPTAIAFLQGVAKICETAQASLLIVPVLEDRSVQQTVQQAAVDGFIVYCLPNQSDAFTQVLKRQLPVVVVDQPTVKGFPSVAIDDRHAAYTAATHLLKLNHQRLAIISLEFQDTVPSGRVDRQRIQTASFPITQQRWQGYMDAICEAGLDPEAVLIEECAGNSEESAFQATLRILSHTPRPTGILAMSDRLALGALRAARQLGLSIPADLSIVGFDDIPLAAQVQPRLTTVHQPLIEKGTIAAELLLKNVPAHSSRVLPTELMIRESSGVAPTRD